MSTSALVQAGNPTYADASIGAISVGRQWIASTVTTGLPGPEMLQGSGDDDLPLGGGVTDNEGLISSIASVAIKGQALGGSTRTITSASSLMMIDMAQIGTAVFKFEKGPRTGEFFDAAPTTSFNLVGGADFILSEFYPRVD